MRSLNGGALPSGIFVQRKPLHAEAGPSVGEDSTVGEEDARTLGDDEGGGVGVRVTEPQLASKNAGKAARTASLGRRSIC